MPLPQHLSKQAQHLVQQVQHNCDISDARHAGNYTLCIYLLKMREYYRWIHALDFSDNLETEQMSQWLREKEDVWDRVVDEPFQPISIAQRAYDAFDTKSINHQLSSRQEALFYHAGIGQKAAQHFFLAKLLNTYTDAKTQISITGEEYARDLTAPPAMSTRGEIIVRQESLRRLCWERYQEWHWNQLDNPMGTALAYYPFQDSIEQALNLMVDTEQHTLIQHELGEMQITTQYGTSWSPMMMKLLGTKAELLARSVRDHLADCLRTLPFLIAHEKAAALHFYFANLTHMRKQLFPSAMSAYQHWSETGNLKPLIELSTKATLHWEKTLCSILEIDSRNEQNPAPEIVSLVEQSPY